MADFSYLSDTDESAVEELISQAQDLCVLEQVSAINCASFSDSSLLPTDLESRFRKLKSFPLTDPRPKHSTPHPYTKNDFNNNNHDNSAKADGLSGSGKQEDAAVVSHSKRGRDEKLCPRPRSPSGYDSLSRASSDFSKENEAFSPSKENPNGKRGSGTNVKRGSISSPSNSSDSSLENLISSTTKQGPDEKRRAKLKPQPGLFSSPVGSSNSLRDSPSPPKKIGCFWCSPKKASHNNSKENHPTGIDLDWGKNDEYLSALSSFSTKQQQKMLKKAMKEEEKISREAEKIVKWAKQASARLSVSGIEDELSDD
ncbi:hypothetical protein I3843_10G104600 [Carya illinoinensis]|uniref:Hepatoma-derived growth factor-related protein 2-like n=1 Tax=Carya illinoinensis TaxID=32201 RepID=A0A8T1PEJ4_CARIL|nr:uncharacterized protein LOC122278061 [Carya illinoinensis]KAG2685068.1 hypothetical protein I3760_10G107200 [Carya illinoinensis]KAG6639562.1 hypothetical protein CIPAW_10G109500 [Carya illinoinensis]KAG7960090.1 hypothetical protein I3843_10G104600 [Carya illinoinensis]